MTRRRVHRVLGEWIGHFPVAGWLRVACGYIQRCSAGEGIGWDQPVSEGIINLLQDVQRQIAEQGDPVKGHWLVDPTAPVTVWADASSLALGVVLEIGTVNVEDAAWLRPKNDSAHINRSELDAVLRGLNLALRWGKREIVLKTDSATVYGWLRATIERTHNVKTRALSERLIRRRLDTLRELIDEEDLQISAVQLVPSKENVADALTRVPKKWLNRGVHCEVACAAAPIPVRDQVTLDHVQGVHNRCHFGVARTLELCRERFGKDVTEEMVKQVVSRCDHCARVDPAANFRWDRGAVAAPMVWQRWAADITHVAGRPYLSVIDTASGFTIWRELRDESGREVSRHLHQLFAEFGPPESFLSDNGPTFCCRVVASVLSDWDVRQELACAYRPQGNGVVERVHRTVKRIVQRSGRSVEEAVF